jgi:carbamate kinase
LASELIVLALGGNALLRRGEPLTEDVQRRNVAVAADAVAAVARFHRVVVTHGNGPQVGLLALESEAYKEVPPYGLDVLGAESQGMIGFFLEQGLRNALNGTAVATLLTTVLVDEADPAFKRPTKFVGPAYSERLGRELAKARGWRIARDGERFRRVVPSPEPKAILELEAIRALIDAGVLVICAGGGGVPVVRRNGDIAGVAGVIDKDLTSALLAEALDADRLLLLTDVPHVEANWRTPAAQPIRETTVSELRKLDFAPGSMGPKVEAACRFAERTGRPAAIGALADASEIIAGRAGTIVRPVTAVRAAH